MRKGFSLIELSIILIVIGILLGGVLVGTSLVGSAKVQAVVVELSKYEAAIYDFRKKYHYLPGTMPNAEDYWGINSTHCNDTGATATGTCNGTGTNLLSCSGTAPVNCDLAWNHLGKSGFVDGEYDIGTGTPSPGVNVAEAAIDGAYYTLRTPGTDYYGNTTTSWNSIGLLGLLSQTAFDGAINSANAYSIDKKLDDGVAYSGKLFTVNENPASTNTCVDGNSAASTPNYIMTNEDLTCVVYYWLEK